MRAVITFHSISDARDVLSFPPEHFDALLDDLSSAGVPLKSLDDLIDSDNGVAITFDDGMSSVAKYALPILRRYDAPAHIFLTTGYVGKRNDWPTQPKSARTQEMLNWRDIDVCIASGVRIECHTENHPDLRSLSIEQVGDELETANETVLKHCGRQPKYFAYPYGFTNRAVSDLCRSRFSASFSTRLGFLKVGQDKALLPRLDSYYLRERPGNTLPLYTRAGQLYLNTRSLIRSIRGHQ